MARRPLPLALAAAGLILAVPGAEPPRAAAQDGGSRARRPVPPNPGPCPNDPDGLLPDRVNKAIDLGVAWLKKQGPRTGCWGDVEGFRPYRETDAETYKYPAGLTSLVMFTLLKCGVPPDDPVVVRGFQWIQKHHETPCTSYEISMLVLALEARSNPPKKGAARQPGAERGAKGAPSVRVPAADAAWMKKLLAQLVRRREKRPGWRYNQADPPGSGSIESDSDIGGDVDMSSTQLAMLALAAGERCGFRQPDDLYLGTVKWVLEQQEKSGPTVPRPGTPEGGSAVGDRARGWSYLPIERGGEDGAVTGSMTACGMANLTIAGAILAERKHAAWTGGLADRADRAWWDGSAWFAENWSIPGNPIAGSRTYAGCYYYYLYCLERAGDLRGVNLIGGHDWYADGALYLVDAQYPDGSWWGLYDYKPEEFLGTCFALLFLDRASRAVATGD